ncbi:MAG: ArsR family transcriptional regulator, partial [Candidatus Azotimanducaceae bacterium]
MDLQNVIGTLSALAQETRLLIFRELVKNHSPDADSGGLAAGAIANVLGISASSLSFHLKEMSWNGLVTSRKEGRSVIYKANLDCMQNLVHYLLEDCCGGACSVEPLSTISGDSHEKITR